MDTNILNGIIEGHRRLLFERYDYDRIASQYELPPSFTIEKVGPLRTYFLEYIYPTIERRQELDDAFASLDSHIRQPEKLGRIVLDSASLLFKYGRHLPKIFRAGFKALQSFRSASKIEQMLAQKATESDRLPPYSAMDIRLLLTHIGSDQLHHLVDTSVALYDILFDHRLVTKIIEVIDHLISKMRKHPGVYSKEEIYGMELGRTIITEGDALISRLNPEEQQFFKTLIEQIERDAIKEIERLREWNTINKNDVPQ